MPHPQGKIKMPLHFRPTIRLNSQERILEIGKKNNIEDQTER